MTKAKSEPDTDAPELPPDVAEAVAQAPTLQPSQFDVPSPAEGEAPATFDPETMRSALDHPQHPLRHLKDVV
jgi:hypothetical protein